MVLMIDANVVIDVFTKREPFFTSSHKVLTICAEEKIKGVLWTGEVTTINYILQRVLDKAAARRHTHSILELFDVVYVTKKDMLDAESSDMPDYEDAVIAYGAKRAKADYIITRNIDDFKQSPVTAITPEDFLQHMKASV